MGVKRESRRIPVPGASSGVSRSQSLCPFLPGRTLPLQAREGHQILGQLHLLLARKRREGVRLLPRRKPDPAPTLSLPPVVPATHRLQVTLGRLVGGHQYALSAWSMDARPAVARSTIRQPVGTPSPTCARLP